MNSQEKRQISLNSVPVNSNKGALSDLLSSVFLRTEGNLPIKNLGGQRSAPKEFWFYCKIKKTNLLLFRTVFNTAQKRKLLGQPYESSKYWILQLQNGEVTYRKKTLIVYDKKRVTTRISKRMGSNPALPVPLQIVELQVGQNCK